MEYFTVNRLTSENVKKQTLSVNFKASALGIVKHSTKWYIIHCIEKYEQQTTILA